MSRRPAPPALPGSRGDRRPSAPADTPSPGGDGRARAPAAASSRPSSSAFSSLSSLWICATVTGWLLSDAQAHRRLRTPASLDLELGDRQPRRRAGGIVAVPTGSSVARLEPLQRHVRGFGAGVGDEEAGRRARRRWRRCRPLPCRTSSRRSSFGRFRRSRRPATCSGRGCTCRPTRTPRSVARLPVDARAHHAPSQTARPIQRASRSPPSTGARAPAAAAREQRRERQHERAANQRRAPHVRCPTRSRYMTVQGASSAVIAETIGFLDGNFIKKGAKATSGL